jgi:hypothetical protein
MNNGAKCLQAPEWTDQGLEGPPTHFSAPLPHLGLAWSICRKEARKSMVGSDHWSAQPRAGLHEEEMNSLSLELCGQQMTGEVPASKELLCQMLLELPLDISSV